MAGRLFLRQHVKPGSWRVKSARPLPFNGRQTTLNVIGITPGRLTDQDFSRVKRAVVLHITFKRCGEAYTCV
jgi:hypothetical protein